MTDMENKTLVERVEHAPTLRRTARAMLSDSTLLHFQPSRRGMVVHISTRLGLGQIFDEEMAQELDTLIANLEREAEKGMHHGWQHDECDNNGGYETVNHDDRARDLLQSASLLRRLHDVIALVLDSVDAVHVTMTMLEDA